jgi:serine/threonine-protein phosphatase 2A activator
MYNAEVLSKFPVVQHFNFGSLFSWECDPEAPTVLATAHTSSQPSSRTISVTGDTSGATTSRSIPQEVTRAPWATNASSQANQATVTTSAPWARLPSGANSQPAGFVQTHAPWTVPSSAARATPSDVPTSAPWAATPGENGHRSANLPQR